MSTGPTSVGERQPAGWRDARLSHQAEFRWVWRLAQSIAWAFLALLPIAVATAQPTSNLVIVSNDPSGSCGNQQPLQYNYTNGNLWGCKNGTWTNLNTGGGGSVTITGSPASTYCTVWSGASSITGTNACTLASGTITLTGSIVTGSGGSAAGYWQAGQGPSPSLGTTAVTLAAPPSGVTSWLYLLPPTAATGVWYGTASGTTVTGSILVPQGNGSKVQLSTGSTTTNDCVKFDANGNTVDNGSACGSGGGGSSALLTTVTFGATPAFTVTANTTPQIFNLSTALSANVSPTLNVSSATAGQEIGMIFTQAASGGPYTVTYPSGFTGAAMSPTAGAVQEVIGTYNGTNVPLTLTLTNDTFMTGVEAAAAATPASTLEPLWPDNNRHTWTGINSSGNTHIMPRTAQSGDQLGIGDLIGTTANQLLYGASSGGGVSQSANLQYVSGLLDIGASGTLGGVVLGNATSGTVTIEPATGALGSVTFTVPAITGTALLGGNNITSAGCIAYETSSGVVTCSSSVAWNGVELVAPRFQTQLNSQTSGNTVFHYNVTATTLYYQEGAVTGSGSTSAPQYWSLEAQAATTIRLINSTASTGATRVEVALGAADSATTQILTVDGSMGLAGTATAGGAINLGTSQTAYLTLQNTTASLSSGATVQVSPSTLWSGTAYQTTAAASQTLQFQSYVLPVTGSALTGSWVLQSNINGAGFNNVFSVSQTGLLTIDGVTMTGTQGTGPLVFATSPTLTTPALGVATATSLAIGGCTIGANAFCVTGTSVIASVTISGAQLSGSNLVFGTNSNPNTSITLNTANSNTATGGGLAVNMATGTASNTSGVDTGVQIQPTINQASGTGGYCVLCIAPKVTAQGSGSQYEIGVYAGSAGTTLEASMSFGGVWTDAGEIFTAAAPTVGASQIGFGSTTAASTNCGTIGTGCIVINVAGTTRYITYY